MAVGPAEIVAGAELEGIELIDGRAAVGSVAKEGIAEFSGAIVVPKAQAHGVLWGVRIPAAASLNPESGVDLESGFAAIVGDEFGGDGAFPIGAVALRVLVNSLGTVEIIGVHGEGERGKFLEGGDDFVGVGGIVDDVRVHFVIGDFSGPGGRGVGRIVGLDDDVVQEEVALGIDIGGEEVVLEGGGAKDGGGGNRDGGGVEGAVGRGGLGAIGGEVDLCVGGGGGNGDVEGGGVVAAVDVKRGVIDEAELGGAGVFCTWSGRGEETGGGVADVVFLGWIRGGKLLEDGAAVWCDEGEVLAVGAEAEIGVKVAGGVSGVGAGGKDDEVFIAREGGAGGEGPLLKIGGVIGEEVAAEVEGGEIAVVDFDPVAGVAVAVCKSGITGDEFADAGGEIQSVDGNLEGRGSGALGIGGGEGVDLGEGGDEGSGAGGMGDGSEAGRNFDGIGISHVPAQGHGVAGVEVGVVGGEGVDGGEGGGRVEGEGSVVVDEGEVVVGKDAEGVSGLEDGDVIHGAAEVVGSRGGGIVGCDEDAGVVRDGVGAGRGIGGGGGRDAGSGDGAAGVLKDSHFAGALDGVVAEGEEVPGSGGEGERVHDGGVGGAITIAQEGADLVAWRGSEIDADAAAIVAGAGESFEEAIEAVEGGGAKPPRNRKLVGGLDFGRGIDFESGAEGEVVTGIQRRGEALGRGICPDDGARVFVERISDDRGAGVGFVESVVGDEIGLSQVEKAGEEGNREKGFCHRDVIGKRKVGFRMLNDKKQVRKSGEKFTGDTEIQGRIAAQGEGNNGGLFDENGA